MTGTVSPVSDLAGWGLHRPRQDVVTATVHSASAGHVSTGPATLQLPGDDVTPTCPADVVIQP